MVLSLLTVLILTSVFFTVHTAEFKKHVQNCVYPFDVETPTYNIESWAKQLHLQQCAFVEVGDKHYAIFVETRPRRYDNEKEIHEYFLGLCDDDTLSKWSLCSSNLFKKRSRDCTFHNNNMYGARVHRRFCDVSLISQEGAQCECNSDLSDSKLFKVTGFPTCFKAPLPDSLCGDNNVCGLASCRPEIINKKIYSAKCDKKCLHRQPFCERPDRSSSQPRVIKSFWTDWSNPYCTDSSCVSQFDEATCINSETGRGDIDCLGPGTSCCTPDIQNCRCHVYEENGTSKVFRTFSMPQPEIVEYMSEEDFINSIPLRYLNNEEFHKYSEHQNVIMKPTRSISEAKQNSASKVYKPNFPDQLFDRENKNQFIKSSELIVEEINPVSELFQLSSLYNENPYNSRVISNNEYSTKARTVRSPTFGEALKKTIYNIYEKRPVRFGNRHQLHRHPLKDLKSIILHAFQNPKDHLKKKRMIKKQSRYKRNVKNIKNIKTTTNSHNLIEFENIDYQTLKRRKRSIVAETIKPKSQMSKNNFQTEMEKLRYKRRDISLVTGENDNSTDNLIKIDDVEIQTESDPLFHETRSDNWDTLKIQFDKINNFKSRVTKKIDIHPTPNFVIDTADLKIYSSPTQLEKSVLAPKSPNDKSDNKANQNAILKWINNKITDEQRNRMNKISNYKTYTENHDNNDRVINIYDYRSSEEERTEPNIDEKGGKNRIRNLFEVFDKTSVKRVSDNDENILNIHIQTERADNDLKEPRVIKFDLKRNAITTENNKRCGRNILNFLIPSKIISDVKDYSKFNDKCEINEENYHQNEWHRHRFQERKERKSKSYQMHRTVTKFNNPETDDYVKKDDRLKLETNRKSKKDEKSNLLYFTPTSCNGNENINFPKRTTTDLRNILDKRSNQASESNDKNIQVDNRNPHHQKKHTHFSRDIIQKRTNEKNKRFKMLSEDRSSKSNKLLKYKKNSRKKKSRSNQRPLLEYSKRLRHQKHQRDIHIRNNEPINKVNNSNTTPKIENDLKTDKKFELKNTTDGDKKFIKANDNLKILQDYEDLNFVFFPKSNINISDIIDLKTYTSDMNSKHFPHAINSVKSDKLTKLENIKFTTFTSPRVTKIYNEINNKKAQNNKQLGVNTMYPIISTNNKNNEINVNVQAISNDEENQVTKSTTKLGNKNNNFVNFNNKNKVKKKQWDKQSKLIHNDQTEDSFSNEEDTLVAAFNRLVTDNVGSRNTESNTENAKKDKNLKNNNSKLKTKKYINKSLNLKDNIKRSKSKNEDEIINQNSDYKKFGDFPNEVTFQAANAEVENILRNSKKLSMDHFKKPTAVLPTHHIDTNISTTTLNIIDANKSNKGRYKGKYNNMAQIPDSLNINKNVMTDNSKSDNVTKAGANKSGQNKFDVRIRKNNMGFIPHKQNKEKSKIEDANQQKYILEKEPAGPLGCEEAHEKIEIGRITSYQLKTRKYNNKNQKPNEHVKIKKHNSHYITEKIFCDNKKVNYLITNKNKLLKRKSVKEFSFQHRKYKNPTKREGNIGLLKKISKKKPISNKNFRNYMTKLHMLDENKSIDTERNDRNFTKYGSTDEDVEEVKNDKVDDEQSFPLNNKVSTNSQDMDIQEGQIKDPEIVFPQKDDMKNLLELNTKSINAEDLTFKDIVSNINYDNINMRAVEINRNLNEEDLFTNNWEKEMHYRNHHRSKFDLHNYSTTKAPVYKNSMLNSNLYKDALQKEDSEPQQVNLYNTTIDRTDANIQNLYVNSKTGSNLNISEILNSTDLPSPSILGGYQGNNHEQKIFLPIDTLSGEIIPIGGKISLSKNDSIPNLKNEIGDIITRSFVPEINNNRKDNGDVKELTANNKPENMALDVTPISDNNGLLNNKVNGYVILSGVAKSNSMGGGTHYKVSGGGTNLKSDLSGGNLTLIPDVGNEISSCDQKISNHPNKSLSTTQNTNDIDGHSKNLVVSNILANATQNITANSASITDTSKTWLLNQSKLEPNANNSQVKNNQITSNQNLTTSVIENNINSNQTKSSMVTISNTSLVTTNNPINITNKVENTTCTISTTSLEKMKTNNICISPTCPFICIPQVMNSTSKYPECPKIMYKCEPQVEYPTCQEVPKCPYKCEPEENCNQPKCAFKCKPENKCSDESRRIPDNICKICKKLEESIKKSNLCEANKCANKHMFRPNYQKYSPCKTPSKCDSYETAKCKICVTPPKCNTCSIRPDEPIELKHRCSMCKHGKQMVPESNKKHYYDYEPKLKSSGNDEALYKFITRINNKYKNNYDIPEYNHMAENGGNTYNTFDSKSNAFSNNGFRPDDNVQEKYNSDEKINNAYNHLYDNKERTRLENKISKLRKILEGDDQNNIKLKTANLIKKIMLQDDGQNMLEKSTYEDITKGYTPQDNKLKNTQEIQENDNKSEDSNSDKKILEYLESKIDEKIKNESKAKLNAKLLNLMSKILDNSNNINDDDSNIHGKLRNAIFNTSSDNHINDNKYQDISKITKLSTYMGPKNMKKSLPHNNTDTTTNIRYKLSDKNQNDKFNKLINDLIHKKPKRRSKNLIYQDNNKTIHSFQNSESLEQKTESGRKYDNLVEPIERLKDGTSEQEQIVSKKERYNIHDNMLLNRKSSNQLYSYYVIKSLAIPEKSQRPILDAFFSKVVYSRSDLSNKSALNNYTNPAELTKKTATPAPYIENQIYKLPIDNPVNIVNMSPETKDYSPTTDNLLNDYITIEKYVHQKQNGKDENKSTPQYYFEEGLKDIENTNRKILNDLIRNSSTDKLNNLQRFEKFPEELKQYTTILADKAKHQKVEKARLYDQHQNNIDLKNINDRNLKTVTSYNGLTYFEGESTPNIVLITARSNRRSSKNNVMDIPSVNTQQQRTIQPRDYRNPTMPIYNEERLIRDKSKIDLLSSKFELSNVENNQDIKNNLRPIERQVTFKNRIETVGLSLPKQTTYLPTTRKRQTEELDDYKETLVQVENNSKRNILMDASSNYPPSLSNSDSEKDKTHIEPEEGTVQNQQTFSTLASDVSLYENNQSSNIDLNHEKFQYDTLTSLYPLENVTSTNYLYNLKSSSSAYNSPTLGSLTTNYSLPFILQPATESMVIPSLINQNKYRNSNQENINFENQRSSKSLANNKYITDEAYYNSDLETKGFDTDDHKLSSYFTVNLNHNFDEDQKQTRQLMDSYSESNAQNILNDENHAGNVHLTATIEYYEIRKPITETSNSNPNIRLTQKNNESKYLKSQFRVVNREPKMPRNKFKLKDKSLKKKQNCISRDKTTELTKCDQITYGTGEEISKEKTTQESLTTEQEQITDVKNCKTTKSKSTSDHNVEEIHKNNNIHEKTLKLSQSNYDNKNVTSKSKFHHKFDKTQEPPSNKNLNLEDSQESNFTNSSTQKVGTCANLNTLNHKENVKVISHEYTKSDNNITSSEDLESNRNCTEEYIEENCKSEKEPIHNNLDSNSNEITTEKHYNIKLIPQLQYHEEQSDETTTELQLYISIKQDPNSNLKQNDQSDMNYETRMLSDSITELANNDSNDIPDSCKDITINCETCDNGQGKDNNKGAEEDYEGSAKKKMKNIVENMVSNIKDVNTKLVPAKNKNSDIGTSHDCDLRLLVNGNSFNDDGKLINPIKRIISYENNDYNSKAKKSIFKNSKLKSLFSKHILRNDTYKSILNKFTNKKTTKLITTHNNKSKHLVATDTSLINYDPTDANYDEYVATSIGLVISTTISYLPNDSVNENKPSELKDSLNFRNPKTEVVDEDTQIKPTYITNPDMTEKSAKLCEATNNNTYETHSRSCEEVMLNRVISELDSIKKMIEKMQFVTQNENHTKRGEDKEDKPIGTNNREISKTSRFIEKHKSQQTDCSTERNYRIDNSESNYVADYETIVPIEYNEEKKSVIKSNNILEENEDVLEDSVQKPKSKIHPISTKSNLYFTIDDKTCNNDKNIQDFFKSTSTIRGVGTLASKIKTKTGHSNIESITSRSTINDLNTLKAKNFAKNKHIEEHQHKKISNGVNNLNNYHKTIITTPKMQKSTPIIQEIAPVVIQSNEELNVLHFTDSEIQTYTTEVQDLSYKMKGGDKTQTTILTSISENDFKEDDLEDSLHLEEKLDEKNHMQVSENENESDTEADFLMALKEDSFKAPQITFHKKIGEEEDENENPVKPKSTFQNDYEGKDRLRRIKPVPNTQILEDEDERYTNQLNNTDIPRVLTREQEDEDENICVEAREVTEEEISDDDDDDENDDGKDDILIEYVDVQVSTGAATEAQRENDDPTENAQSGILQDDFKDTDMNSTSIRSNFKAHILACCISCNLVYYYNI